MVDEINVRLESEIARRVVERVTEALETPTNGEPAMKRLTIDVPLVLHTEIKTKCARQGTKMADVIRELLEVWVNK